MSRSSGAAVRADPQRSVRARRLDVFWRVVAAVIGGYFVTAVGTAFLARVLPMARADATALATLLSFVLYTAAIVFTFAARSAFVAWLGLALAACMLWAGLTFDVMLGGKT